MTPRIVAQAEWLDARQALLAEEKAFQKARDALSEKRRALPWVKIEKNYVFDGPDGGETLAQLFAGRSQLIVQHFMFAPDWDSGCKSCSFWADGFSGIVAHLNQRDTGFVAVSRAPLAILQAFAKRQGWSFKWVSAGDGDFNYDFNVAFTPEQRAAGAVRYNYAPISTGMGDLPGISVFATGSDGAVYHTYSCYARGLDNMNTAYQLLDLVPKGRDEDGLPYPMDWVRIKDEYPPR